MEKEILKRCIEKMDDIIIYGRIYHSKNESNDVFVSNLLCVGVFEDSIEGIIELYKKDGKDFSNYPIDVLYDIYKKDIKEVIDELFKKLDRVMIWKTWYIQGLMFKIKKT